MEVSLDHMPECVMPLLYTILREYNIRIFMFGDYQFLCYMYGISGASGQ